MAVTSHLSLAKKLFGCVILFSSVINICYGAVSENPSKKNGNVSHFENISICILIHNSQVRYNIVLDTLDCSILNYEIMLNVSCNVTNHNKLKSISAEFNLKPLQILNTFYVCLTKVQYIVYIVLFEWQIIYSLLFSQVKLSMFRKQASTYKTFMGMNNLTIDLCKYLGGGISTAVIDILFPNARTHSNVFHPCPFSV